MVLDYQNQYLQDPHPYPMIYSHNICHHFVQLRMVKDYHSAIHRIEYYLVRFGHIRLAVFLLMYNFLGTRL